MARGIYMENINIMIIIGKIEILFFTDLVKNGIVSHKNKPKIIEKIRTVVVLLPTSLSVACDSITCCPLHSVLQSKANRGDGTGPRIPMC